MVVHMDSVNIKHLKTESRNEKTLQLDTMSVAEILRIMNEEDQNVIKTIKEALPQIEASIYLVVESLKNGGRLIYAGAGTSGRLGILDAVECVPTFSTSDEVIGIIAGGEKAFIKAVEGAEDSKELAKQELANIALCKTDIVIAIAASGRTPYAIGALEYAKEKGAKCVSISCNKNAELSKFADVAIEVDAGPEVLTGSTRLKAGTCQKIILNMISTVSMVRIGKVFGNLMVDMKATNLKLMERAKRIVMESTDCDYESATRILIKADWSIKPAIVMLLTGLSKEDAKKRIIANHGFIRDCISIQ